MAYTSLNVWPFVYLLCIPYGDREFLDHGLPACLQHIFLHVHIQLYHVTEYLCIVTP